MVVHCVHRTQFCSSALYMYRERLAIRLQVQRFRRFAFLKAELDILTRFGLSCSLLRNRLQIRIFRQYFCRGKASRHPPFQGGYVPYNSSAVLCAVLSNCRLPQQWHSVLPKCWFFRFRSCRLKRSAIHYKSLFQPVLLSTCNL